MNDRTNQAVAVVAVVLLIIGAWYFGGMQARSGTGVSLTQSSSNDGAASTTDAGSKSLGGASATTPVVSASSESITVVDQPAGPKVAVASVTLKERGWVAVRDNNGRVLGAGRFEAGTSKNVVVELLRATVPGERYQVLLYIDDGDNQYDLHKDSLVMNADASVAGTTFSAQ